MIFRRLYYRQNGPTQILVLRLLDIPCCSQFDSAYIFNRPVKFSFMNEVMHVDETVFNFSKIKSTTQLLICILDVYTSYSYVHLLLFLSWKIAH